MGVLNGFFILEIFRFSFFVFLGNYFLNRVVWVLSGREVFFRRVIFFVNKGVVKVFRGVFDFFVYFL